jgi:hypothetical protein
MAGFKIEELFSRNISGKLGISKYKTSDVTQEELTPHMLQRKALDVYERRPFVHAGINQMINFVAGTDIKAVQLENLSKDVDEKQLEKDLKWLNTWIDLRKSNLVNVKSQCILSYLVQGNTYIEKVFRPGEDVLDNLFTIFDSSKIYYNTSDTTDKDKYWLFEVATEIPIIKIKGKEVAVAEFTPYKYSPSSVYYDEMIRAFHMPYNKITHLRAPYTLDGYYGYSFVMSTLDDEEAISKIIRNIILISSNKAVGKKIIGFHDDNNRVIPQEDIDDLQDQIDFDAGSNLVVNKKFTVEDLAHTGTYDTMIPEIEYLTKDVGSGLTPSFMTPWNSDVNRATAEQARLPFIVHIENIKKIIEEFFSRTILDELIKQKPGLKNVKIVFGETEYYSLEERTASAESLYNQNIITMNQYLEKMGMDPVENGDVYAREREAQLDKIYEDAGNDKFSEPGAGNASGNNYKYNKEAVGINPKDLYDYEHQDDEDDTMKHSEKHLNDLDDEIQNILRNSF